MYCLINRHIDVILKAIPESYVTDYDWLIQNVRQVGTADYQAKYRRYWGMDAAHLSAGFREAYFNELRSALDNPTDLGTLVARLHETPTYGNGRRSLQFSFATKLLHTTDRRTPIYDSFVAAFYFFEPLGPARPLEDRIRKLVSFHDFLSAEFARVLAGGLLAKSILAFRSRFMPQCFTDERIIDALIWAYVDLLKRGALGRGEIDFW